MSKPKHLISVFGLVMINVAALGGIRNWAPIAECGFSSVFLLTFGSLLFLIPLALISAELATTWPGDGGVYGWVKKAFGHRMGFLAIWFLWIQNVIWYPTALAIIASMVTYVINPALVQNKTFMAILVVSLFWGATFLNLKGIKISTWVSTLGAICGTFIPSVLIIAFGIFWYVQGKPLQISFTVDSLIPSMTSFGELGLFAGVIVSLLGMEMSAVHANNVKNPQSNYPKAIFFTTLSVILFSSLGVLAIAMVVPQSEISLNAGCLQAFEYFFREYGLQFLMIPCAIIMAIGVLGSMSTWIMGPCVGLLAASKPEYVSGFFRKTNEKGVPSNLLIIQAALVSVLSLLFLFMPTINSAYWILLVLSTQLYLLMYLLLFTSAIRLRVLFPDVTRPFKVPGGRPGIWICGLGGVGVSVFALSTGFALPEEIS
ncbi:MAG: putative glutamate/gamma-aminobutyrate antiporter, partial [Chlamydiae bacterium]|nr:putative glutamate/gamma-aminobutyrate antiporter [Chlamydiota bacterium]